MPEIPNLNAVLETFMHYWYENMLVNDKVLQTLTSSNCTIQISVSKENQNEYKTKQTNKVSDLTVELLLQGVENIEIIMWTPQILGDGYSLSVMANWNDKNGNTLLISNDTFYLQRISSS